MIAEQSAYTLRHDTCRLRGIALSTSGHGPRVRLHHVRAQPLPAGWVGHLPALTKAHPLREENASVPPLEGLLSSRSVRPIRSQDRADPLQVFGDLGVIPGGAAELDQVARGTEPIERRWLKLAHGLEQVLLAEGGFRVRRP